MWRWTRRPTSQPDLRVSTAERNAVAELLSQHYAEGRLDASEFDDRLEHAMAAKTGADLSNLLLDLPGPKTTLPVPTRRPRRAGILGMAVLVLVVGVAASVSAWSVPHIPWLLVALVVIFVWSRRPTGPGRRHRRHETTTSP
jgi:hypothetical protein